MHASRREFLKATAASMAAPYFWSSSYVKAEDKNNRPVLGMIGCGGKGRDLSSLAVEFGDFAAVCDVDQARAETYANNRKLNGNGTRRIEVYEDYRKLLDRKDIDAVIVATPDHWHTLVFVSALKAGKHVYGEKPMTLTIDEGKILRQVVKESGRVLQVGNQQRSSQWFREAIAIVQSGVLGGNITATCSIGRGPKGGPFAETDPPSNLNWDRWLGQAPYVPYVRQRCHGTFRWWLEYSGGKLTDWGAHHIDIAQWAIGGINTGPVEIEGSGVFDKRPNCYNAAQTFKCTLTFANGNKIIATDEGDNGILFTGEQERIFVNRGKLVGNLIDKIAADATSGEQCRLAARRLYEGPYGIADFDTGLGFRGDWTAVKRSHMGNFFNCQRDGSRPISDVDSVHRGTTSCHLCNIAMLLGRKLQWDPDAENFVGDADASSMLSREQRMPYSIQA